MYNKVEALKSRTIMFTIEMVKTSLSDFLVEEILEQDSKFESLPIIEAELNTKEKIKALKNFLDSEIKQVNRSLYESCMEELKEIKEDLTWKNSKEGIFILELEDWVVSTRTKLINAGLENIFVGRSIIDPKELNIGGIVKDEGEIDQIKTEINSWAPPTTPNYLFEVGV